MDSLERVLLMSLLEKWDFLFANTTKEHSDSCKNMLKTSDLFTLKTSTLHLTTTPTSLVLLVVVNLFCSRLWLSEANHTDGEISSFKCSKHVKLKEVLAK